MSSKICKSYDGKELAHQAGPWWYPQADKNLQSITLVDVVRMSKEDVDELIKKLQHFHYY